MFWRNKNPSKNQCSCTRVSFSKKIQAPKIPIPPTLHETKHGTWKNLLKKTHTFSFGGHFSIFSDAKYLSLRECSLSQPSTPRKLTAFKPEKYIPERKRRRRRLYPWRLTWNIIMELWICLVQIIFLSFHGWNSCRFQPLIFQGVPQTSIFGGSGALRFRCAWKTPFGVNDR